MTKKWVAFASVLLLSGTAAVAAGWADNFQVLDTDGSGAVSQGEFDANVGKLKLGTFQPEFSALDKDNNNSIDADEWTGAEKIKKAYGTNCKESASSWCPCQNNPDDPECQK